LYSIQVNPTQKCFSVTEVFKPRHMPCSAVSCNTDLDCVRLGADVG